MLDIKQIFAFLNRVSSLNKKDAFRLIHRNRRNELLKRIFEITYNPFLTYNSAIPKDEKERFYKGKQSLQEYEKRWKKFQKLIHDLLTKNNEGEKTFSLIEKFLQSCNNTSWKERKEYGFEGRWYTRIINKNLEIISKKQIKEIWPDIKTDFIISSPTILNKKHRLKYPLAVEPIYNGMCVYIIIIGKRCFVIDDKGNELYNLNFIAKLFVGASRKYCVHGCLKAKWTKKDHEKYSSAYGKLQSLLSIGKRDNFCKLTIKEKNILANNLKLYLQDVQCLGEVFTAYGLNHKRTWDKRRETVTLYFDLGKKKKWKGLNLSKWFLVENKEKLNNVFKHFKKSYYGVCVKSDKVYIKKFWKDSSVGIITSIKNKEKKSIVKCLHEKNGKVKEYKLTLDDVISKKLKYHYIELKDVKVRTDLSPVSKIKIQDLKSRITN